MLEEHKDNTEPRWNIYARMFDKALSAFLKISRRETPEDIEAKESTVNHIYLKQVVYPDDPLRKDHKTSESSTFELFSYTVLFALFVVNILYRILFTIVGLSVAPENFQNIANFGYFPIFSLGIPALYILSKRRKIRKAEKRAYIENNNYIVQYRLRDKPTNIGIVTSIVIGLSVSIGILFL